MIFYAVFLILLPPCNNSHFALPPISSTEKQTTKSPNGITNENKRQMTRQRQHKKIAYKSISNILMIVWLNIYRFEYSFRQLCIRDSLLCSHQNPVTYAAAAGSRTVCWMESEHPANPSCCNVEWIIPPICYDFCHGKLIFPDSQMRKFLSKNLNAKLLSACRNL